MRIWLFLRELAWLAILAIAALIAGGVAVLLGATLVGIFFAIGAVALAVLTTARTS